MAFHRIHFGFDSRGRVSAHLNYAGVDGLVAPLRVSLDEEKRRDTWCPASGAPLQLKEAIHFFNETRGVLGLARQQSRTRRSHGKTCDCRWPHGADLVIVGRSLHVLSSPVVCLCLRLSGSQFVAYHLNPTLPVGSPDLESNRSLAGTARWVGSLAWFRP